MLSRTLAAWGCLGAAVVGTPASAQTKTLYEKTSAYAKISVTEDENGLRTLLFDNDVRQSVGKVGDPAHLELPYTRAMPVGLAFVDEPKRMLIVGLGGGTIPSFLHKHYPRCVIDVVDIDPDVVDVAKRFFGFREDATLRAYVNDGRRFIDQSPRPYDIIFLDAYGPDNIPYHLATREFLQAVRRKLAPTGAAVANVWSSHSNPLYHSMVRTYQEVFDEIYIQDVRGAGNRILVALPWKSRYRPADLAQRARDIAREKKLPLDLERLVADGCRLVTEKDAEGDTLRDGREPGKPDRGGRP
jgi:spermidine synthase